MWCLTDMVSEVSMVCVVSVTVSEFAMVCMWCLAETVSEVAMVCGI